MNATRIWQKLPRPVWVLVVLGLCAAGLLLLRRVPYQWAGWTATNCWPVCFCEAARENFIRQPINTLSNLAFVAVGVWIVGVAGGAPSGTAKPRNLMSQVAGYRLLYGVGVLAIGVCSIFYHASLTAVGQWFDWLGIYILFAFVVFYNLTRLLPLPHPLFGVGYGLGILGLSAFTYYRIDLRLQIFSDLLLIALVLEMLVWLIRRPKVQWPFLVGALVSLFVGRYAAVRMGEGDLCVPTSWIQGHAIWHGLTALATGLLYLYYESETVRGEPTKGAFGKWIRIKARRP